MSKFSLDIGAWAKKQKQYVDVTIQQTCFNLFSRIIYASPVDTGLFRGNWQVTTNYIPEGELNVFDKTCSIAIGQLNEKVPTFKAGQRIYLTNNLPYARMLEYGHSKQAPNGMIRVTLLSFKAIVNDSAVTTSSNVTL